MNWKTCVRWFVSVTVVVLATGCATQKPFDYTAYKASRPRSIVVLPPLNSTTDVKASNSVLTYSTLPLAESGYYVFPVTLVAETFKENGLPLPADIHAAPVDKLRQIFGADAAMYINITRYGSVYQVVNSVTVVSADAKLVDLKMVPSYGLALQALPVKRGKTSHNRVAWRDC